MARRRRNEEINSALDDAIAEPVIVKLLSIRNWFSTGCTLLDLAISDYYPGGVPAGRYIHIYGAEATAKTVLAMTILGSAQRNGLKTFFNDVENTFDEQWARLFGLQCDDSNKWNLTASKSIEDFFDEYLNIILEDKDDVKKVIAVDSLTAMPSEKELSEDMTDLGFQATRPKQIGLGLRKYMMSVAKSDTTIIFIDQTRDNIGGYGERVSGGRALPFYASVRIHLFSGEKIVNKFDKEIGVWIKFKIEKNKVAAPYKEGRFKILWDYGIDNIATNLDFIASNSVLEKDDSDKSDRRKGKKKTGWYSFNGIKKRLNAMIDYIEEEKLEKELDKETADLWFEIHKPEKRKARIW